MRHRALLLALALFFVAGVALAAGTEIPQSVLSGGGGHAQSGTYTLNGAIGQPVVGKSTNGSLTLYHGFLWRGDTSAASPPDNDTNVYLPIVIKNN